MMPNARFKTELRIEYARWSNYACNGRHFDSIYWDDTRGICLWIVHQILIRFNARLKNVSAAAAPAPGGGNPSPRTHQHVF